MQLTVTINGEAEAPLLSGTTIHKDVRQNRATLLFALKRPFRLDISKLNTDTLEFDPDHAQQVIVKEGGTTHFTGLVIRMRRFQQNHQPLYYKLQVDAVDYMWLTGRRYITATYDGQSDRAILKDIISTAGLANLITTSDSNIDIIDSDLSISFFNQTVSEALETVAELTGGILSLGPDANLYYNTAANATAAAFDVSDAPDDINTFAFRNLAVESHFERAANQVTVVTGEDSDGNLIETTVEEATSQARYSLANDLPKFQLLTTKTQLGSSELTTDWGTTAAALYGYPQTIGRFEVEKDGLEVNRLIDITSDLHGFIANSFVIKKIDVRQKTDTLTSYTVEFGDDKQDAERMLRKIDRAARQQQVKQPFLLKCLEFNLGASVQQFVTADNTTLGPNLASATVAFWVWFDSLADNAVLVSKRNASPDLDAGWQISAFPDGNGNKLQFHAYSVGANTYVRSDPAFTLKTWHHVAVTWINTAAAAADVELFVDGEQLTVDTSTDGGAFGDDSLEKVRIGKSRDDDEPLKGYMAQFAMYNDDLGGANIQGLAREPSRDASAPTATTLAFWRLNDYRVGETVSWPQSSSQIKDSSGNQEHGTTGNDPVGAEKLWSPKALSSLSS